MNSNYLETYKAMQRISDQVKQMQVEIQTPLIDTMKPYQEMMDRISASLSSPIINEALKMSKNLESIISINNDLSDKFSKAFSGLEFSPDLINAMNNFSKLSTPYNWGGLPDDLEDISYENDCIDLPQPIVELITELDDSLSLPESDSDGRVLISKSNIASYQAIIGWILAIISIFVSIYLSEQNDVLQSTQHAEIMKEEKIQTQEEIKQTKFLEQIAENTSSEIP